KLLVIDDAVLAVEKNHREILELLATEFHLQETSNIGRRAEDIFSGQAFVQDFSCQFHDFFGLHGTADLVQALSVLDKSGTAHGHSPDAKLHTAQSAMD